MPAVTPTYLSGYLGSMEVDNTALKIQRWTATHQVGTADVTNSTSSGAQEVIRTIESMNGSADVVWAATSGQPAHSLGSIYSVELFTGGASAQKYVFNALINSHSVTVDIRGNVTYSVSFMSTGAITVAA